MTIQPLFANVLLKAKTPEEVRASGIIIPDTAAKERPQEAEVIAVGKDCKMLKKGQTVIFKKYSTTEIKIKEEEYLIIPEEDVLATVE